MMYTYFDAQSMDAYVPASAHIPMMYTEIEDSREMNQFRPVRISR